MKPAKSVLFLWIGTLLLCLTTAMRAVPVQQPASTIDLERALGKWYSTERFENEPRITVALRSKGSSLEGWAVLLGQHRRMHDRIAGFVHRDLELRRQLRRPLRRLL